MYLKSVILAAVLFALLPRPAQAQNWEYQTEFTGQNSVLDALPTPDGNVWVLRNGNIRVLDASGQQVFIVSQNTIRAIGLSPGNLVYAVTNAGMYKYDLSGVQQGAPVSGISNGTGIAFTGVSYYIAFTTDVVRKYFLANDQEDPAFISPSIFGVTEKVAYDGTSILVADSNKGKVFRLSPITGAENGVAIVEPTVAGVDYYNGRTYTTSRHKVRWYNGNQLVDQLGSDSPGNGDEEFNRPESVRFDYTGRMVVGVNVTDRVKFFTEGVPLPIELTSFEARLDAAGNAIITATTATEINNEWMVLEYSANGAEFAELDRQPGHGTTSEPQRYDFVVPGLQPGNHYFRLRQVDYDGTETFSDVISLRITGKGEFRLFPNLVSRGGETTLTFPEAEQRATVEVFTVSGQLIYSQTGEGSVSITAGSPGIYVLTVTDPRNRERIFSGRFVVQQ